MEQLIFVGILVLFSILEAVARKNKGPEGGGGEDLPAPPPREPEVRRRPRPQEAGPPSYDDDPSFDDVVRARGGEVEVKPAASSSEGLIPKDIWEEISALARGEVPSTPAPRPSPAPKSRPAPPTRPLPAPRQPARTPKTREAAPVQRSRPAPPAGISGRKAPAAAPTPAAALEELRPDHALHLTHAGLGEPVGGRLTPLAQEGGPRRMGSDIVAARKLLVGGAGTLRQAVILTEVLGPPASMKDE